MDNKSFVIFVTALSLLMAMPLSLNAQTEKYGVIDYQDQSKNGNVKIAVVHRGKDDELYVEIVRVAMSSPTWISEKKDGKDVVVSILCPIIY